MDVQVKCFVEVDLVQAEWVVTAFIAQDPRMMQVFTEDKDPHLYTGSLLSGAPMDFVLLEDSVVGKTTNPVEVAELRRKLPREWGGVSVSNFYLPRIMSIRQCGKKGNHGLNYGMSYKRFALESGMEEKDAAVVVDTYRNIAYPGLKEYYRTIERELRTQGRMLKNCFGQACRLFDYWGPDLLDAAYAFKPQSTVANITNFGLHHVYEAEEPPMDRVLPAAQVHDSLLTQNEFDSYAELGEQIRQTSKFMSTSFCYYDRKVTLRRDIKVGMSWGERSMVKVKEDERLEFNLQAALAASKDAPKVG